MIFITALTMLEPSELLHPASRAAFIKAVVPCPAITSPTNMEEVSR
jgi:hypothetical protein